MATRSMRSSTKRKLMETEKTLRSEEVKKARRNPGQQVLVVRCDDEGRTLELDEDLVDGIVYLQAQTLLKALKKLMKYRREKLGAAVPSQQACRLGNTGSCIISTPTPYNQNLLVYHMRLFLPALIYSVKAGAAPGVNELCIWVNCKVQPGYVEEEAKRRGHQEEEEEEEEEEEDEAIVPVAALGEGGLPKAVVVEPPVPVVVVNATNTNTVNSVVAAATVQPVAAATLPPLARVDEEREKIQQEINALIKQRDDLANDSLTSLRELTVGGIVNIASLHHPTHPQYRINNTMYPKGSRLRVHSSLNPPLYLREPTSNLAYVVPPTIPFVVLETAGPLSKISVTKKNIQGWVRTKILVAC